MPQRAHRRVVALTGAASGIGRALAVACAARGDALALADRERAGLEATRALLPADAEVTLATVDVADRAAVDAYAAQAIADFGAVDVVVNNAGVSLYGSVLELDLDEIAWLMNINFYGVVHGVKAFLPHLLQRPAATLVNLSSVFGLWAPPGQSAYAASKFAVRGFTESLRGELAGTNVHVITVHPAGVRSGIARSSRVAAAADAEQAARMTEAFDRKLLTIPPETAAQAILAGIDRKRDRVLIGSDAYRIDALVRALGPLGAQLLNRRVRRPARP